ncbi:MAG: zinc-binding dehydrogenase [Pseudomonadales bacterium]
MLQVNIHGVGKFQLDEVALPQPGPKDVLVKVEACGICGSDLGYVAAGGLMGPAAGLMPLGHELSGCLVEVGSEVEGLKVGDRVVVDPMHHLIGNGGPEGGFAPLLLVRDAAPGKTVHVIPDNVSHEIAALVEPLAVAMHAVNQAQPKVASKVAVLGAGPIGLGVVAALRHFGVTNIVAIDLSDQRLNRAKAMGARELINSQNGFMSQLQEFHGCSQLFGMDVAGTDIFIDATGAAPVVEAIVGGAKPGACLIIVGLHKKPVAMDLANVLMRELVIKGAIGYPIEFPQVIAMIEEAKVNLEPMISHRYSLADFNEAFTVASNTDLSAKVMVFP